MNSNPPKLFLKFLRWYCHPDLIRPIEGDLMELYEERVKELGKKKADRKFIKDVILLFRKGIIRPADGTQKLNYYGMLKHNILISIRSFRRFKSTFLINLLGLSSGLAATMLIYLWVHDELSMNKFQERDSDRHVQVIHTYPTSGTFHTNIDGSTPNPLYERLAEDLPEIAYSIPVSGNDEYLGVFSANNQNLRGRYQFIGEGFFNVFPANFLLGDKANFPADKNDIAISATMAKTLFGSPGKAIGNLIDLKGSYYDGSFLVTAVFEASPNASEPYDVLLNYDYFATEEMMQWYNGGTQTHLVLEEGVDLEAFNEKLKGYLTTLSPNWKDILYAQPYAERYLYDTYENGAPVSGRIIYVQLFSIIALIVLVVACINYMNFSTAKASRRIKEIGVKKAIGVGRKALIFQYFIESILMACISLFIAVAMVAIALPQFNEITDKQLTLMLEPNIILTILAITGLTGLLSGIYPALHLSSFKPIVAMKGKLSGDKGALLIRQGLVVFQFAISVIMIVSALVVYRQISFIQTVNLGYNKEHIITFPKEGKLKENTEAFLSEIRAIPGVVKASQMSGELPGRIGYTHGFTWNGMSEADKKLRFYKIYGGYDLIDLLGITIKEGRNFSKEFSTDKDAVIMNETAVQMMQLQNPVGEAFGNLNPNVNEKEIIGVVENFHFQSFHEEIKPFFFSLSDWGNNFVVKIQAGAERKTIEQIEEVHGGLNPGFPFDVKFMDDSYQQVYASEERITVLSKYFTGIAIVISCLGLLALTSFSTQQRFKEIAIRKVLGSTNLSIVRLVSRDFTLLVAIAVVIGLPIAYFMMKSWLDNFAYRIALEPLHFIIAGVLILMVAVIAIFTQIAKSTKFSVSESLRADG